MRNVLPEAKMIKLRNEQHYVENKTRDIASCLTKAVNFYVPKHIK
jgi:hypothetical protein